MATADAMITASNRPDTKVLEGLVTAERFALAVTSVIAAAVLCAWLVPAVAAALPDAWSLMNANTALAVLLCAASLAFVTPTGNARWLAAGRACALAAVLLAGVALFEHWSGRSTGLDTLLASDSAGPVPGRMSIQTASVLVVLGLSLTIGRGREGLLGYTLDVFVAALVWFILVLVAAYLFGATTLIGQSPAGRTSPQTLVCLALLVFVQTSHRAPYGYWSVLVGVGIGSQIARIALPISAALAYLIISAGAYVLGAGYVALPYAAALTASSLASLLFLLVVMLTRWINHLERELRDMSLTDELTGLHNRRGFYLLGEQKLRDARRDAKPLTVLFFDADGLKTINDTLGHDVGSDMLRDIANLLRTTFRTSEVVGRLGGDEFAVVGHGPQADFASASQRMDAATEAANAAGAKPYRISFSAGGATAEARSYESFTELVDRADAAMYQEKRRRRAAADADSRRG